ncbi:MAG: DUF1573 domain-containing protein [Acidobacteriota bacterium]
MRSAFLFTLAALVAMPMMAAPTATVVESIRDFEVVAKGDHLVHSFEIRNDGDQPLEITDVRPACGCTVTEYDKVIAPGATGKVHADVDTATFDGPIAKSIAVFTNDTENPKLQLVVKATVQPYLAIDPGYARFNYVQGEAMGTINELIFAPDFPELDIIDITNPFPFLLVEHRPATTEERNGDYEGNQWVVSVTINEDAPVGSLGDYIKVATNHPKQQVAMFPVSGFVRPRQHITPNELNLGSVESANLPVQRLLHVQSFAVLPIEVKSIETGHEALTTTLKTVQEGHRFNLEVEIGPGMPKGPVNGVIKIHTTDAQNPVIEVPLRGSIL